MEKTDYTHTNRLLTFILFSGLMLAVLSCANTVHASPSTIYVNATGGNDSWNGTSWNTAKQTIGNATGTVANKGTIHIANGNYNQPGDYGITITKNMTITGQSQTSTIIDAQNMNRIFTINSGVYVNIQNLTLTNGQSNSYVGGAISNDGTLIVSDCTFTGNTETFGGAIYNYGGTLTVSDSTFTGNTATSIGGAIYNNGGTVTVTNSTFNHNTAHSGGAINNVGTLTVIGSTFNNNREAIYNSGGTLTVIGSTFTNTAGTDGAAIWCGGDVTVTGSTFTNNGGIGAIWCGGDVTVTGSTFTNNGGIGAIWCGGDVTVTGSTFNHNTGGAISGYGVTVTGSRFINNIGVAISSVGTVNAVNNWWGSNDPDFTSLTYGHVTVSPWLVLTVTANPTSISVGDNSTITADLLHNSLGELVNGPIPQIPVTFHSSKGTLNPEQSILIDGRANSIFTMKWSTVKITVTVDNQIVSTLITIKIPTTLIIDNTTGFNGETINLTAKLTDIEGNPLTGENVDFSVNGINIGSAITNNNGIAEIEYTINQKVGTYNITANFTGDNTHENITGIGKLTVKIPANTILNPPIKPIKPITIIPPIIIPINPGNSGNSGDPGNPGGSGNSGDPGNPGGSGNSGDPGNPGGSGDSSQPGDSGNDISTSSGGSSVSSPTVQAVSSTIGTQSTNPSTSNAQNPSTPGSSHAYELSTKNSPSSTTSTTSIIISLLCILAIMGLIAIGYFKNNIKNLIKKKTNQKLTT